MLDAGDNAAMVIAKVYLQRNKPVGAFNALYRLNPTDTYVECSRTSFETGALTGAGIKAALMVCSRDRVYFLRWV